MTYVETRAAMQLIAEQDVGRVVRSIQRKKDRKFDASIAALKAEEGR